MTTLPYWVRSNSVSALHSMRLFYAAYADNEKLAPMVREIGIGGQAFLIVVIGRQKRQGGRRREPGE